MPIQPCNTCSKHPHTQDQINGKGQRTHNEHRDKLGARVLRCTVCGTTTTSSFGGRMTKGKGEGKRG